MKRIYLVVVMSLVLITGLCGVFSVNESPSGHIYNPSYTQAESYTIVPITESSITIYPDDHDSTINATTIYSTDGVVPFTIESLVFAYTFVIRIDGVIISNTLNCDSDVRFTHNLGYGNHGITIDWCEYNGAHYSNSFSFMVIPYNHYFQNNWSKLYPYSNGSSTFGAVRPALIVEGFSIPGLISGNAWYLASRWNNSMSSSKRYILTFNDPFDHVQDNAMVVLGALRFIHNSQTTPLVEGTSIYGYSMGGILARYALAYAEQWNIQHFCTQYVSIDSPHRGATINLNLQETMQSIKSTLGGYNKSDARLNAALSALNSDAAKQLIRENKNADNNSYNEGSFQYRSLFAEINEEDNLIHELLDGDHMSILNASPDSYEGALKPGFPYKQNNVKSFAYSNGGLGISGNVNNDPLAVSWHLNVAVLPNDSGQAAKCEYDRQPGSVLEDFSTSDSAWLYDFELTQNYAPVLVPTRSSLYLKRNSMSGGSLIPELEINTVYLSALTDYANDLLDHTYFDHIVYAPNVPNSVTETIEGGPIPHEDEFNQWNWRHGELGWRIYDYDDWVTSNIATSTNWLNQNENRSVCMIKGQIDGDFSNIEGTILINGQGHGSFSIDQNGFYSIPYLYTKDARVRLAFTKSGWMSSYRDININYSNAMLHDQIVPNVTMYAINLNNIRVSSSGNGSFNTINAAVDFVTEYIESGLYNGQAIKIIVQGPGTYPESVDLSQIARLNVTNFTLEGEGDVTINSSGSYGIKLTPVNGVTTGSVFNIKNLKIRNASRGIVFQDYYDSSESLPNAPHITLNISNCMISDCGFNWVSPADCDDYSAAAVHFEGAGSIASCNFENNALDSHYHHEDFQAGAVFVYNNKTDSTEVKNCTFTNNRGVVGGGLVVKGSGLIIINNNKFSGNHLSFGSMSNTIRANALSLYNANNVIVSNNVFLDSTSSNGTVVGLMTCSNQQAQPIKFTNNTIINTANQPSGLLSALSFSICSGQDIEIRNNVISSPNTPTCNIDINDGLVPMNFDHNILHNTSTNFAINVSNEVLPRYNYVCDPLLDANYYPIWDATTMSPCIDAGCGEPNPDGTPPEIGAKPTLFHQSWEYSFTTQADLERWYWVSYPVLNTRTTNMLKASIFFEELLQLHENTMGNLTPTYLDEIDWMVQSSLQKITWLDYFWNQNQSSHYVSSPQGYKIKLLTRTPSVVTLRESGFKTSSYTQFPIYGGSENWLGYFKEAPAWPHEAFASIWNDITMVKAKNWCLFRGNTSSDYWGMHGKVAPLSYGDMVIVTTNNDHTFQWNNAAIGEIVVRAVPEHFVFNEKQDYVPVYLSLPDSLHIDLKEIGLYLDGVCKGAVVVESNIEQICAYLDVDEKLTDGVVEFVFYYNTNKSQDQERRTIRMDSSRFNAQYAKGDVSHPFYDIDITKADMDNIVPKEYSLLQNYPNPFNPNTTISYQLPESGNIRLDVYNIKGQLVKTLINASQVAGYHSVAWNGTDLNNRGVASGVYFYRLSSPKKTITKRMLLMK